MTNSILNDIKKQLGMVDEYTEFDTDIIISINSVLSVLKQMGVGPKEGFVITSSQETWDDYLGDLDQSSLNMVKTYIYQKVRLIFDPPQSSALLESINRQIAEFEWRLYTESGGY